MHSRITSHIIFVFASSLAHIQLTENFCTNRSGKNELYSESERSNYDKDQRFSGGVEARKFAYPFVALIEVRSSTSWLKSEWVPKAHALILNPYTLLSTYNETDGISEGNVRIIVGMHDLSQKRWAVKYRYKWDLIAAPSSSNHGQYTVIYLSEPLSFNDNIFSIKLPPRGTNYEIGAKCLVVTWHSENNGDFKVPVHAFVKIAKCRHLSAAASKQHACIDGELIKLCPGIGAPLICTKNNEDFLYGLFTDGCSNSDQPKERKFVPLTNIDRRWLQNTFEEFRENETSFKISQNLAKPNRTNTIVL